MQQPCGDIGAEARNWMKLWAGELDGKPCSQVTSGFVCLQLARINHRLTHDPPLG